MRDRKRKKADKLRRQKIHALLDLVLDVNGGARVSNRKVTGYHPTAFFSYSGHVDGADVRVHKTGWVNMQHSDYQADIFFRTRGADEKFCTICSELKKMSPRK